VIQIDAVFVAADFTGAWFAGWAEAVAEMFRAVRLPAAEAWPDRVAARLLFPPFQLSSWPYQRAESKSF